MWQKRTVILVLVMGAVFCLISPVAAENRFSGDFPEDTWNGLSVEQLDESCYFTEYFPSNESGNSFESQMICDENHLDLQFWARSDDFPLLNEYMHCTYSPAIYEIIPDIICLHPSAFPTYHLYKKICNGIYRYEINPGISIPVASYPDEKGTVQKGLAGGKQSEYFSVDVPEAARNILINLEWPADCDDLFLIVYPPDAIIGPLYDSNDEKADDAIHIDISGKNNIPAGKWYFKVVNDANTPCSFNFSCYYR